MLSFKKASTIQLQLSNPKSKFYGGDKIEGLALVSTDCALTHFGLRLTLTGIGHCSWLATTAATGARAHHAGEPHSEMVVGSKTYYSHSEPTSPDEQSSFLPAGTHRIPFSITIPTDVPPTGILDAKNYVKHVLIASLNLQLATDDPSTEIEVTVVGAGLPANSSSLQTNAKPSQQSFRDTPARFFLCCPVTSLPSLETTVHVHNSIVELGGNVRISVHLDPLDEYKQHLHAVTISLVQIWKRRADHSNLKRTDVKEWASLTLPRFPLEASLTVPHDLPCSFPAQLESHAPIAWQYAIRVVVKLSIPCILPLCCLTMGYPMNWFSNDVGVRLVPSSLPAPRWSDVGVGGKEGGVELQAL